MENLSSDEEFDELSERFGSYSLSADVSECESSSSCSYRQFDREGVASTSMSSPPLDERDFSCNTVLPTPLPVTLPVYGSRHVKMPPLTIMERPDTEMSEVELMKERFAKLLLGEDMSGGGKGVCTALAISNAITSLSATVFGQLWKLEPLAPHKKAAWCRDMDWLLCVSDSIVELVPSLQEFPGGGTFEVMVTRPRSDLYVNLPALKKLDAMLLTILDGFSDSEFYYVDRGVILSCDDDPDTISVSSSSERPSVRQQEKWWLPFPKVPPNGLSEDARKKLQQCKECTSQILKAAMAINSSLLAEMEISNVYFQSLPKSGKTCLGEIIHRYITAEKFSPDCLIDYLDLSSEYTTLEIANRIEAAVHIWRQKYLKRHLLHAKSGKSSWGEKVKGFAGDIEKYKLLAYRAETLLHCLKVRFPGLPQTALDMSKIQHNKDVGQSILESYSRVLESLAFNIMARIDDLLCVDDRTKQRAASGSMSLNDQVRLRGKLPKRKRISPNPFSTQHTSSISPITLPGSYCTNQMVGSPVERTHQSAKKSNVSEATLEEQFEKLSF